MIRAKWKGSDPEQGHLYGIPASDLSEDDWQALSPDDRQRVRDSGLYTVKTNAEMQGSPRRPTPEPAPEAPTEAEPEPAASSEKGGPD